MVTCAVSEARFVYVFTALSSVIVLNTEGKRSKSGVGVNVTE
jgi:hypothetical protein